MIPGKTEENINIMDTRPGHLISETFRDAFRDYLLLLEKGYPQKLILKMVGDRHALSGIQRSMLYRGVTTAANNQARAKKQATSSILREESLLIDTFNVLITIGSYLNGRIVYISTDGMLRDASEFHGNMFRSHILDRALSLMVSFLLSCSVSQIICYIDQQVSACNLIYEKIAREINQAEINGSATIDAQVDKKLIEAATGIIASSDSTIIYHTLMPVFDLPFIILQQNFHPDFIDLRLLLPKNVLSL